MPGESVAARMHREEAFRNRQSRLQGEAETLQLENYWLEQDVEWMLCLDCLDLCIHEGFESDHSNTARVRATVTRCHCRSESTQGHVGVGSFIRRPANCALPRMKTYIFTESPSVERQARR